MSCSPVFDPYAVLNIPKNADIRTIRQAHRVLVLKYHPDRIKDGEDLEQAREQAREHFQKVQDAYELLSDEARRSSYDDKVKLAELRKQAHGREAPVRSPRDPTRTQFSSSREYDSRDGHYYEERVPRGAAFFEEEGRYREEPPRASAREGDTYERKGDNHERDRHGYERKGDNYERERHSYGRKGDEYEKKASRARTEKKTAAWTAAGISSNLAQKLQKEAANARERTNLRAANAKLREQERRRNATDKQSSRRAAVEDYSSSDSDTVTYDNVRRNAAKVSSSSYTPRASNTERSRRGEVSYSDDDDDDHWSRDKHQVLHASARDYIQRSATNRPREVARQDSSHSYFEPRDDKPYARRSGSDREDRRNERDRTQSAGSRRPSYSEVELPRDLRSRKMPKMTQATSAPANIKIPEERRAPPPPHRSRTMQAVRDHRSEMPPIPRSNTMPVSGSARRSDNIPPRGSNLKHAETQDSGYGSSSPATPDMHGTSPTKYSATRYQIVDEVEEFCRGPRTILVDPEDSGRRTRSPVREQQQQRPSLSTSGKRPTRAATAYIPGSPIDGPPSRPMPSRHESMRYPSQARETSHWGSGHRERKPLYREISSDEQDSGYTHRVSNEKAAPRAQDAHYPPPHRVARDGDRDEDYYPGSNYRSELRNPGMGGTRPSVY